MKKQTDPNPVGMSQEEYVKKKGMACPACRSENYLFGNGGIYGSEGKYRMDMECMGCFSTWVETYELAGYTKLTLDKLQPR